jgi:hypothetical protein
MTMTFKSPPLLVLAAALCFLAGPTQAQAADEHLVAPIPPEFTFAGQPAHPRAKIMVYLPAGQAIETWTEQLIVTTYANQRGADPAGAARAIDATWRKACKEAEPATILAGKSNGYATATLLLKCAQLSGTDKPEASLTHLIAGTDNFYMIQRNTRHLPAADEIKQMIRYMGTVKACDDRAPDHPCPAGQ